MIGVVIEVKENYVCSKNEIHRYCEKLPEHQRPLRVYFGRVIRNATGKIDKKLLREYIVNNKKVW